jgi:hypothetical protein
VHLHSDVLSWGFRALLGRSERGLSSRSSSLVKRFRNSALLGVTFVRQC